MERNTQQRQAIIQVIENSNRPLSIHEVRDLATHLCRGIGIATVYRNLKALVLEGKIVNVEMPGGLVLYEASGTDHHHHFSCGSCHKVFDISGCGFNFQELIPPGFQVHQHEIILSGLCQDCLTH